MNIPPRVRLFSEKFSEAWTSCMFFMVQGNVASLTIEHAFIASQTGALTGLALVVTSLFHLEDNRVINAGMTGILTMIADMIVHPTHFGAFWTEAAMTGLGAYMLAFIYLSLKKHNNNNTSINK